MTTPVVGFPKGIQPGETVEEALQRLLPRAPRQNRELGSASQATRAEDPLRRVARELRALVGASPHEDLAEFRKALAAKGVIGETRVGCPPVEVGAEVAKKLREEYAARYALEEV